MSHPAPEGYVPWCAWLWPPSSYWRAAPRVPKCRRRESHRDSLRGPMEVHASPSEAVKEQIRVPDVEGEDWEDTAHTVRDAGFEFGNVVAVADRHPVVGDLPIAGGRSRLEQGEGVSLTLSMGLHPPESVDRLACLPEEEEHHEPYCIGKLINY